MAKVRVAWDNEEKTAILWRFSGRWTWEDYYAAKRDVIAMMESVEHKVDSIVDLRQTAFIPSGGLSQARALAMKPHPNEGITVMLSSSLFMKTTMSTLGRLYSHIATHYRMADDLDEARALLREMRDSSP